MPEEAPTTQPSTIATARLTETEQQMLSYAQMPLTPGERREFLHYLDVAEMPQARVETVVERILGDRLAASEAAPPAPVERGVWRHEDGTACTSYPDSLNFTFTTEPLHCSHGRLTCRKAEAVDAHTGGTR